MNILLLLLLLLLYMTLFVYCDNIVTAQHCEICTVLLGEIDEDYT